MQTTRDVTVGEEITITYGEKHNDDLLQYFGFLELDCAFDRYVVENPIATLQNAIAAKMASSSSSESSGSRDYPVQVLEAMDRLVKTGLANQKGTKSAGSPAPLIATRIDGVTSQSLGDLMGILDLGNSADSVVAKKALVLLMQTERQRIEDAISNGCLSGLQSTYGQCVARYFILTSTDFTHHYLNLSSPPILIPSHVMPQEILARKTKCIGCGNKQTWITVNTVCVMKSHQ